MFKLFIALVAATFVISACTDNTTDDVNRCLPPVFIPPVFIENPNAI